MTTKRSPASSHSEQYVASVSTLMLSVSETNNKPQIKNVTHIIALKVSSTCSTTQQTSKQQVAKHQLKYQYGSNVLKISPAI